MHRTLGFCLKVSKNRNDFMKTSFGPKSNVIFGPNDVFIKSFRFLSTFREVRWALNVPKLKTKAKVLLSNLYSVFPRFNWITSN
jgi:hypothetical protein